MALPGWRATTVSTLSNKIGPPAEIIVDDALRKQGLNGKDMAAWRYVKFLELLYQELPDEIDRSAMVLTMHNLILKKYGFAQPRPMR